MEPPAFCTGSTNTAHTVSGPSISMARATWSAVMRPKSSGAMPSIHGRYVFVFGTFTPPGVSGSNGIRMAGTPVMARAPNVVPWYAVCREITL